MKFLHFKRFLVVALLAMMTIFNNVARADMILVGDDDTHTFKMGIDSENKAHIYGAATDVTLTGDLVIPVNLTHGGTAYPVIRIRENAFSECAGITSLTFATGSQLLEIGEYAFYNCTNLSGDIIMPNSINSIGYGIFEGCTSLTGDLKLSESLTTLDRIGGSFTGTLTIPASVTWISERSFTDSHFSIIYIMQSLVMALGAEETSLI